MVTSDRHKISLGCTSNRDSTTNATLLSPAKPPSAMMVQTPRRNSPPHDRQLAGAHSSRQLAASSLAPLLLPCRARHLRLRPLRRIPDRRRRRRLHGHRRPHAFPPVGRRHQWLLEPALSSSALHRPHRLSPCPLQRTPRLLHGQLRHLPSRDARCRRLHRRPHQPPRTPRNLDLRPEPSPLPSRPLPPSLPRHRHPRHLLPARTQHGQSPPRRSPSGISPLRISGSAQTSRHQPSALRRSHGSRPWPCLSREVLRLRLHLPLHPGSHSLPLLLATASHRPHRRLCSPRLRLLLRRRRPLHRRALAPEGPLRLRRLRQPQLRLVRRRHREDAPPAKPDRALRCRRSPSPAPRKTAPRQPTHLQLQTTSLRHLPRLVRHLLLQRAHQGAHEPAPSNHRDSPMHHAHPSLHVQPPRGLCPPRRSLPPRRTSLPRLATLGQRLLARAVSPRYRHSLHLRHRQRRRPLPQRRLSRPPSSSLCRAAHLSCNRKPCGAPHSHSHRGIRRDPPPCPSRHWRIRAHRRPTASRSRLRPITYRMV